MRYYSSGKGKKACGHKHKTLVKARDCALERRNVSRVSVYRVDGKKWTRLKGPIKPHCWV